MSGRAESCEHRIAGFAGGLGNGITVNNIQPGPTETEARHIDMVKPLIPLGRVGQPREVAGLVAYLASEESGYITGSSLTVDGGFVL